MRSTIALLAVLATWAFPARAATIYIPVASALAKPIPSAAFPHQEVDWVTTQTVTNLTDRLLTVGYVRVLAGPDASLSRGCSEGRLPVSPGYSWNVGSTAGLGCVFLHGHPGFVQIDIDEGIVISGSIHLVAVRYCYEGDLLGTPVSLAAAPLPVYDAPFPAGATAYSLDVLPPISGLGGPPCGDINDPFDRRVNLTVANAGVEAATVTVRAPGVSAAPFVFSVPAGEAVQLNGVFPGHEYHVLLVTATQPFLTYASSTTTFSDPSRPPDLAVYPFRLLP